MAIIAASPEYSGSPLSKHWVRLQFLVLPTKVTCITSKRSISLPMWGTPAPPLPLWELRRQVLPCILDHPGLWVTMVSRASHRFVLCGGRRRGGLLLGFSCDLEIICYYRLAGLIYHLLFWLPQHSFFFVFQKNAPPFSPKETTRIPSSAHPICVGMCHLLAPGMGRLEEASTG